MGCRCIDLHVASKGTNPLDDLRTLLALRRHYRALKPDVVFHYTIKPNIYGSVAAWLAHVPSVAVTMGLGRVFSAITRDEVAAWERKGVIAYLGETADDRPDVGDTNCVVLLSYREGVPRTLMETSTMDRPIVAIDVLGCREVVADSEDGLLSSARDAGSLAQAMARSLDMSPTARIAIAKRGRKNRN